MYKYSEYGYILKNAIMILLLINVIPKYKSISLILVLIGYLCTLLNDHLRYTYFYKNDKKYIISLIISFLTGTWLIIFIKGGTELYFFMILYEIIISLDGLLQKILLISHALLYFFATNINKAKVSSILTKTFWKNNGFDFLFIITTYAMSVILFLYLKLQITERKKVQDLNKELNLAYKKLKQYSANVEELAIAKERNRIAADIHDFLGHSLVALIMHLDFLENVLNQEYKDKENIMEIVRKTQNIARESMQKLRTTVYMLKEEKSDLEQSLKELINTLNINEKIKIILNTSKDIENIAPEIKNIIYRTVQEGLTNSIKHGKATKIIINIYTNKNKIELVIKDNGIGCKNVIKGNGLTNIEKRISNYNGEILYSSNNEGFTLHMFIPIEEGKV
ncbi:sensor histidine kinase [Caloranaerobacter azorensis]|uniref:histidine kinase n=1 Tax=Caloranaerobacter azorensis TaxID=116090 RepID=A0A6P1YEW3_9FIRM|nr:sensor histidine kinase [Caloranaerobacter azorensis]QIB27899.1 sensor histidine kinase [Caloranaerobacter azorensis]